MLSATKENGHVETVCLLGKNVTRSKSRVNLSLEVEDYYRIKDSEMESEFLHGR